MCRAGITRRQQMGVWYYLALRTCGEETFPAIFHKAYLGGNNSIKQHILSHLQEEHKSKFQIFLTDNMKEKLYKKQFYEYQRKMLDGQMPLKDITLIYRLLRNTNICDLATDDTAWTHQSQKLEYGIHFIKGERDRLSHESLELSEQEYTERMEHLVEVVKAMLLDAGLRFSVDFSHLSARICQKIRDIQDTNIIDNLDSSNAEHWQKLKEVMRQHREHEEREALHEMMQEITCIYESLCLVEPAPWLLKDGHKAKPPDIFVSMEVQQENSLCNMGATKIMVKHDQLLTVRRPDGTKPTVVILQGEGGAGKSTLMKLVMFHWLEKTNEIKGLSSIPLILFTECRDSTKKSIHDLLLHYCPNTTHIYGSDRLKEIVFSQQLIIIVDGYDEVNPSSRELLNEILAYNGDHITTFITTRPLNTRELTKILPETKIKLILKVMGIAQEQQSLFITKLLQVLMNNNQKVKEEKNKLMKHMSDMTEELLSMLRNPLSLSLIVLMWVENPTKINSLTSITKLFTTFRELTTGKVTERLKKRGCADTTAAEMNQSFQHIFDELAFVTHCRGEFELTPETMTDLKKKTQGKNIPEETEEVFLSSHFTVKISKTLFKLMKIYNFHHRLEQQYACANHLAQQVTQPATQLKLKQVIKTCIDSTGQECDNLGIRFKEVLIFITGILWEKQVLHTFAREIISLVYMEPNDKGQVDVDGLLHHLSECNMDATVLEAVRGRLDHWHKQGIRTWRINSGRHLSSLPHLLSSSSNVEMLWLIIPEDTTALTHLHPALRNIAQHRIKVNLHLGYNRSGFPQTRIAEDSTIGIFTESAVLEDFWGHISGAGVRLLPESLTKLDLDVDVDLIPHLNARFPSLHNLNDILLWMSLSHIPVHVTRLQYVGEKLFIWLCYPGLQDDQATSMGSLLSNLWPATRPAHRRDLGNIWATSLTVAGVEKVLESVGVRGDGEGGGRKRKCSRPYLIKRRKLQTQDEDKGEARRDEESQDKEDVDESGDTSGAESGTASVDRLWMSTCEAMSQEETHYLETVARSYGIVELVIHEN